MSSSGKISVAHIITKLEFGGAQQNTLHTASHLNSKDFDVYLLSGAGGYLDEKAKSLIPADRIIWIKHLARAPKPWSDLAALLEIRAAFKKINPQIVHTHSSKAGILGRWAAYFAGVPVKIHTYHGFGFHDFQPWIIRFIYSSIERITALVTDQLIFVSKANIAYAARYNIRVNRPGMLIRSGVYLPKGSFPLKPSEKSAKRKELGFSDSDVLAVTVANLKAQKNPGDYLKLAQVVVKRVPQARFLFVGGTESKSEFLAKFTSGSLPDRFHYLGWREDAAAIVEASDLYVMTSLWEGLPRSAVEALYRGLPVCAYAVDGLNDIVHEGVNGYLAAPGDLRKLTENCVEVLSDAAKRERMSKEAATTIGQEFDINHMVLQQEILYKNLCDTIL